GMILMAGAPTIDMALRSGGEMLASSSGVGRETFWVGAASLASAPAVLLTGAVVLRTALLAGSFTALSPYLIMAGVLLAAGIGLMAVAQAQGSSQANESGFLDRALTTMGGILVFQSVAATAVLLAKGVVLTAPALALIGAALLIGLALMAVAPQADKPFQNLAGSLEAWTNLGSVGSAALYVGGALAGVSVLGTAVAAMLPAMAAGLTAPVWIWAVLGVALVAGVGLMLAAPMLDRTQALRSSLPSLAADFQEDPAKASAALSVNAASTILTTVFVGINFTRSAVETLKALPATVENIKDLGLHRLTETWNGGWAYLGDLARDGTNFMTSVWETRGDGIKTGGVIVATGLLGLLVVPAIATSIITIGMATIALSVASAPVVAPYLSPLTTPVASILSFLKENWVGAALFTFGAMAAAAAIPALFSLGTVLGLAVGSVPLALVLLAAGVALMAVAVPANQWVRDYYQFVGVNITSALLGRMLTGLRDGWDSFIGQNPYGLALSLVGLTAMALSFIPGGSVLLLVGFGLLLNAGHAGEMLGAYGREGGLELVNVVFATVGVIALGVGFGFTMLATGGLAAAGYVVIALGSGLVYAATFDSKAGEYLQMALVDVFSNFVGVKGPRARASEEAGKILTTAGNELTPERATQLGRQFAMGPGKGSSRAFIGLMVETLEKRGFSPEMRQAFWAGVTETGLLQTQTVKQTLIQFVTQPFKFLWGLGKQMYGGIFRGPALGERLMQGSNLAIRMGLLSVATNRASAVVQIWSGEESTFWDKFVYTLEAFSLAALPEMASAFWQGAVVGMVFGFAAPGTARDWVSKNIDGTLARYKSIGLLSVKEGSLLFSAAHTGWNLAVFHLTGIGLAATRAEFHEDREFGVKDLLKRTTESFLFGFFNGPLFPMAMPGTGALRVWAEEGPLRAIFGKSSPEILGFADAYGANIHMVEMMKQYEAASWVGVELGKRADALFGTSYERFGVKTGTFEQLGASLSYLFVPTRLGQTRNEALLQQILAKETASSTGGTSSADYQALIEISENGQGILRGTDFVAGSAAERELAGHVVSEIEAKWVKSVYEWGGERLQDVNSANIGETLANAARLTTEDRTRLGEFADYTLTKKMVGDMAYKIVDEVVRERSKGNANFDLSSITPESIINEAGGRIGTRNLADIQREITDRRLQSSEVIESKIASLSKSFGQDYDAWENAVKTLEVAVKNGKLGEWDVKLFGSEKADYSGEQKLSLAKQILAGMGTN
ncbi:MAG: hypothetical protein HY548_07525, partial [Elusimicrobia bacterium]|nr:hypothetical protein [Elusimicrobiota bacterium]